MEQVVKDLNASYVELRFSISKTMGEHDGQLYWVWWSTDEMDQAVMDLYQLDDVTVGVYRAIFRRLCEDGQLTLQQAKKMWADPVMLHEAAGALVAADAEHIATTKSAARVFNEGAWKRALQKLIQNGWLIMASNSANDLFISPRGMVELGSKARVTFNVGVCEGCKQMCIRNDQKVDKAKGKYHMACAAKRGVSGSGSSSYSSAASSAASSSSSSGRASLGGVGGGGSAASSASSGGDSSFRIKPEPGTEGVKVKAEADDYGFDEPSSKKRKV